MGWWFAFFRAPVLRVCPVFASFPFAIDFRCRLRSGISTVRVCSSVRQGRRVAFVAERRMILGAVTSVDGGYLGKGVKGAFSRAMHRIAARLRPEIFDRKKKCLQQKKTTNKSSTEQEPRGSKDATTLSSLNVHFLSFLSLMDGQTDGPTFLCHF